MTISSNDFSGVQIRALGALKATAVKLRQSRLATELERIGPLNIAPSQHSSVADHLYSAVLGQQLSLKAASTIRGRVQQAAQALNVLVTELYVPGHEPTLRACGVSGRKAKSLQAIRAADELGMLSADDLEAMPHTARVERLCRIWGVGKWTADMIGIFHFLDEDVWLEGDVTAVAVFRQHTGIEDTVLGTVHYAPYRSFLARYMWVSRDSGAVIPLE